MEGFIVLFLCIVIITYFTRYTIKLSKIQYVKNMCKLNKKVGFPTNRYTPNSYVVFEEDLHRMLNILCKYGDSYYTREDWIRRYVKLKNKAKDNDDYVIILKLYPSREVYLDWDILYRNNLYLFSNWKEKHKPISVGRRK